jgi:hypothetical protein
MKKRREKFVEVGEAVTYGETAAVFVCRAWDLPLEFST